MPSFFERIHRVNKTGNVYAILRRYFANNAFDGAITALGVIMGAFIAGIREPRIILITSLSTSFALFISGAWSAYLTEEAERVRSLRSLERKMLRSLKDTRLGRATKIIALEAAFVDGLSPFLTSIIIIIPFMLSHFMGLPVLLAFQYSVALAFCLLGLLGAYLATISKQSIIKTGVKMVFAGVIAILLAVVLKAI